MKNQKGFANIVTIILVVILAAGIGYFAAKGLKTKSPQPVTPAYDLVYAIGHSSTVNQIQVVDSKVIEPKREGFLANPSYDYKLYLLNTDTFSSKEISIEDTNKLILISSENSPDGARVIKESQKAPTYNGMPIATGLVVSSVFFEKGSIKKSIGKDYEPTEIFRVIGWVKRGNVQSPSATETETINKSISTSTAPSSPNSPIVSATFTFPYSVQWNYQGVEFSLTGVSFNKQESQMTLYFKVKNTNNYYTESACSQFPENSFRWVPDESGDMIEPFGSRTSGCGLPPNVTRNNQEVYFKVANGLTSYLFTTGGKSNIYFMVNIFPKGGIQVDRLSNSTSG